MAVIMTMMMVGVSILYDCDYGCSIRRQRHLRLIPLSACVWGGLCSMLSSVRVLRVEMGGRGELLFINGRCSSVRSIRLESFQVSGRCALADHTPFCQPCEWVGKERGPGAAMTSSSSTHSSLTQTCVTAPLPSLIGCFVCVCVFALDRLLHRGGLVFPRLFCRRQDEKAKRKRRGIFFKKCGGGGVEHEKTKMK